VSNVDIAPTVMDLAGIPWAADGRSLVPLLNRRVTGVRTALLIEWCQAGDRTCPSVPGSGIPPAFWGLETDRYAYIEYATGEAELFDLRTDPFELTNLAGLAEDAAIRQRLSATLALLRAPPAIPATTIGHGPVRAAAPGPVAFDFFSQDRTTGFRCRLAGPGQSGAVATCDGGSVTYALLAPGRYLFSVVGVTAEGVADPTPATRAFTVP